MMNGSVPLANPGLIQYLFVLNPELGDVTASDRQKSLEGLRAAWHRLVAGWKPHPLHYRPGEAGSVGIDFPATLARPPNRLVLAAAVMPHATAVNQAFLLLSSDSVVIVTTLCENQEASDPSAWQQVLVNYGTRMEVATCDGLLGVSRVFFAELPQGVDSLLPLHWDQLENSLRVTLGGTPTKYNEFETDVWRDSRGWGFIRPIPVEIGKGDAGKAPRDQWLVVVPKNAPLESAFVLGSDLLNLPRWVQYHLEMAKTRNYESLVLERCKQFRLERTGLLEKTALLANSVSHSGSQQDMDLVNDAWGAILELTRQYAVLQNDVDELARVVVTLKVGKSNLGRLRPPEVAEPHHKRTLFDEDRAVVERAETQVAAEVEYWRLNLRKFDTTLNVLKVAIEKQRFEIEREQGAAHHRLELRLHLLEIFIIAVYSVEFYHVCHSLAGTGEHRFAIGMAFVVAFLAFLYVNPVSHDHAKPKRWSVGWLSNLFWRWFPILLLLLMCIIGLATIEFDIVKRWLRIPVSTHTEDNGKALPGKQEHPH